MVDKKGKKTQKGKQTKQQKESSPLPSCLSFGKLDIIYKIELNDKDLEKTEEDLKKDENGNKYYNIEDIKSIKDLNFIKDRKNIWDKIILKPNNLTLEQLLIGNKLYKKKMNIEYIGYGCPKFENDEEYFNEIYKYINEKNGLNINEKGLEDNGSYTLKFELIYKNKTYTFGGSEEEQEEKKEENKENKNEEENKQEEKKEEENKQEETNNEKKEEEKKEGDNKEEKKEEEDKPDEYEPNDAMKEEKIPKFSRKDSILCNLNPNNKKYMLFYLNLDELKDIPGNFEKKDLIELINFLKKKGTKIFINYYKPEEEKKEEVEEEGNKNIDNEIAGETYDSSGKINEKEKQRKKEEENKDESKEEKEMKYMNNIYYLTDLYFFDFKQSIEEFNKHYKFFTTDKKDKTVINKQKLIDYFINGIASGTKKEVDGDKYGFFIEDFMKYYVIHANKKKVKKNEFDCQLFPKINHNNIKLIDEYKSLIKKNMNNYVSLFISFLISEILINGGNISNKVYISGFINGLEIIKRKLECERNNININEKDIMKYKISEKNLEERIKEYNLLNKEDDFILDCTNKEKSELKEYIPLYDYHLINYFRSYVNQEELKKKGFVNDKGFVIYDPNHKSMKKDIINIKLNEDEKQNKVKNNIKNIDIGSRIKDKEIESSKINNDNITNQKLPKIKYGIATNNKNKKNNKNDKSPEKSGTTNKSPNKKQGKNKNKKGNKGSGNGSDDDEEEIILLKDKLVY